MNIKKAALESCIADLPDTVDTEEVMYRIYLMEKIESGETDIRNGRTISHAELTDRLTRKWSV